MKETAEIEALAGKLVKILAERGQTIAFAESCTAGLAADIIARIPGASNVFWGSFVCYTADAKFAMLGIEKKFTANYGAVSGQVAKAMALKALEKSNASWSFSITGLAGPGGDGTETSVGTVWLGIAGCGRDGTEKTADAEMFFFGGSRNDIRMAAAAVAFEKIFEKIQSGY